MDGNPAAEHGARAWRSVREKAWDGRQHSATPTRPAARFHTWRAHAVTAACAHAAHVCAPVDQAGAPRRPRARATSPRRGPRRATRTIRNHRRRSAAGVGSVGPHTCSSAVPVPAAKGTERPRSGSGTAGAKRMSNLPEPGNCSRGTVSDASGSVARHQHVHRPLDLVFPGAVSQTPVARNLRRSVDRSASELRQISIVPIPGVINY